MHRLPSPSRVWTFGLFQVDAEACEIRKRGIRLKLPDRSFRILLLLLDKPGQLITRNELRNELWQSDTLVDFDHGVNNAIMRLREVLGDSSDSPRFVETLPRRGYRFIAPVEDINPAARVVDSSVPLLTPSVVEGPLRGATLPRGEYTHRKWLRMWPTLGALAVLLLAAVTTSYLHAFGKPKVVADPSVSLVVLPLENLTKEKDQDYFADGLTDDLIANLAKVRSLRVISRSTAMAYKGTRKSLSEIAKELNVDAVVEGTVVRAGDRVRVTAELVQVSSDHHLWADTYEAQLGDILVLQNQVSSAIVSQIRINLTPADRERLRQKLQVKPDAYENYLKGRYCWNRRSAVTLPTAIHYFEEATREDPQYALAYAGLADSYGIISATIFGTMSPHDAAAKAKTAAERALQLDPVSAEAETSLATVKFNYDWDWSGADAGFQRAISLNPSYGTAHQRYSLYLAAAGHFQNSFDQINIARELDPLSLSVNFSLGWRLYMARQYDRAIAQLRNTLDMDPSYELPHLALGQAYEQKGDFAHAIPELEKAAALSHNTPLMLSGLAHAYALAGRRAEAEKILSALLAGSRDHYVSPYYLAVVYAGLGKPEEALLWLGRGFTERANGLVFLKVDPELDSLRSRSEFQQLQRQLKLPA